MINKKEKWIVVSNRLPFQYDKNSKKISSTSGGLVTAITGVKKAGSFTWVGTVPEPVPASQLQALEKKDKIKYKIIDTPKELYENYYNGFCNDAIWPLFHYEMGLVKFVEKNWQAYKKVNELFAKKILSFATSNDIIWIHDFHLFLLPKLLKEKNPNLKVGFFLHIPFPTSEIYRQFQVREELLEAVLKADLIGFHDYSYLRHFCSSLFAILGTNSSLLSVHDENFNVKFGVFRSVLILIDFLVWRPHH